MSRLGTNEGIKYHRLMTSQISLSAEVPAEYAGNRLDQIAAKLFPDYSRARLQGWIRDGKLTVNEKCLRPRDKLQPGDRLCINAELEAASDWRGQELPLDVVFEDDQLLVINKAAGVVVHPAAGNREGTLLNGLLHAYPELAVLPRAGIVHRLDKDTTGLLVIARTLNAHTDLVEQLQARSIGREYEAVVVGLLTGGGTVDKPLGRHPVNRKKRAVVENGKPAVTHYRLLERFRGHSHVQVNLETGRTHQIRAHMSHINHPLVGDPLYGGRLRMPAACSEELRNALSTFRRQALHARRLALKHPRSGEAMEWTAETPADIAQLLSALRCDLEEPGA